ncbi:hypothetical protein [Streptomyces sp. NPDC018693]|uniref:hypothetical protein n=1 Tax=unclassified Streptomyces TaxID=2593676 RepID=UPI0037B040E5
MSAPNAVDASRLSAECTVAREDGFEDLHARCRRTEDVPLPHGRGLVLVPRCPCPCHTPAEGEAR